MSHSSAKNKKQTTIGRGLQVKLNELKGALASNKGKNMKFARIRKIAAIKAVRSLK